MSRVTTRWGILAASFLSLATWPLSAQGTGDGAEETRARMLHRLDSIMPLLRDANHQAEIAKARRAQAEAAAERSPTDTLQVGLLTVVTPRGQSDVARQIVGEAWDTYASMLTSVERLRVPLLTFQWATPLRSIVVEGTVHRVEMPRWRSRAYVVSSVERAIGAKLLYELEGHRVRAWSAGELAPPWNVAGVYHRMAVTPSKSARTCLAGNIRSCRQALALDPTDDPWPEWYTPEERRRLTTEMRRGSTSIQLRVLAECRDEDSQAACDAFLAQRLPGNSGAPAPVEARAALVWLALEKGGAGSFGRLAADRNQSAAQALEQASGEDLDHLVAEWRDWFERFRPDVPAETTRSRWIALTWVLLFGALAMRSTRWRLG